MLKEFVEKIQDLSAPVVQEIENRKYSTKALSPITQPVSTALEIGSLLSLVEYLGANKDSLDLSKVVVHVDSPDSVSVLSSLMVPWKQRDIFIEATRSNHGTGFEFGRFMDAESFNIQLQSRFMATDNLAKVLRIVGNIRSEKVHTSSDDGITQSVALKAGVTLATEVQVPNPVLLKPFRTFIEVDQPESPFVFRIKQTRDGETPTCALFEADGGKWKLEAINCIKDYLKAGLKDVTVIG
jgi:hypothetical protein